MGNIGQNALFYEATTFWPDLSDHFLRCVEGNAIVTKIRFGRIRAFQPHHVRPKIPAHADQHADSSPSCRARATAPSKAVPFAAITKD